MAASLDQTVEAVEGSSVTLPCYIASANVPTRVEDLNIFWRYNDDKKVFDIVSGYFFENRDPAFINRTEGSGVETYLKGNFSIKLSGVRASDQGEYSCYMHFADITQKVHLQVKGQCFSSSSPKSEQQGDSVQYQIPLGDFS